MTEYRSIIIEWNCYPLLFFNILS